MTREKLEKGSKIHVFTAILIVIVISVFIKKYYNKVVYERDRLEAKRIQQAVTTVLAKSVGSDLTYDNGRVYWTLENAIIIKQGIVENLALDEKVVPFPTERGYYYYMYLDSPYTIVKLPYATKGHPQIDRNVVTKDYLAVQYSDKEYSQIESVPEILDSYETSKKVSYDTNVVVCLNI